MSLAINDCVYVPSLRVYGIIEDIGEGEETFYTVTFPWDSIEDTDFLISYLVKLESPYFPKGSIITGLKGARAYNFTTDKAIMEVINNGDNGRILVKVLQHSGGFRYVGELYWVIPMWFKLARPRTNFYRGEKED